jgi:DNA-3-methyladenine glycosylase I
VDSSPDVAPGDDGIPRCRWGDSPPEYRSYHDREWGRPVGDEARVLEKLCLEGFQAGLSWLTILRKRPAFRQAFASFDPASLAAFGEGDLERLLSEPAIVRHRGKIRAAVTNARATLRLWEHGLSLAGLLWAHEPSQRRPAPVSFSEVPSSTPESKALSAELRRRGFAFVGPTTAYAAMQALGVVNDHLVGCRYRGEAEKERSRFNPPPFNPPPPGARSPGPGRGS